MVDLIKGAPIAAALVEEASRASREVVEATGSAPSLRIVRVGDDPDDAAYERAALKRAERAGVDASVVALPVGCSQDELVSSIRDASRDDAVDAILLMRPLPAHLDERAACLAIDPAKDVDGVTSASLAGVFAGDGEGFAPCTAEAVVEVLERSGVDLDGERATVVGRSLVVGRPAAMLLMHRGATVTICHTRTRDIARACREADIVVACAGSPRVIGPDHLRSGQVVVDVGMNFDLVATAVPGGVGSVTTAVLMEHVVSAARRRRLGPRA